MTEKQTKGVIQAICAVSAELAKLGIAKEHKNQQQGFMFRGIDDIYQALSPLLHEHGVVIAPRCVERLCAERKTARGSTMFDVTVKVEYDVFGPDGSSIEASTYGQSMDTGDKATNKALSMAYKYLAFQLFCIPVRGEEDADATTPEETVDRPAQPVKRKPAAYPHADDANTALGKAQTMEGLRQVWARIVASGFSPDAMERLTQTKDECKALLESAAAQPKEQGV